MAWQQPSGPRQRVPYLEADGGESEVWDDDSDGLSEDEPPASQGDYRSTRNYQHRQLEMGDSQENPRNRRATFTPGGEAIPYSNPFAPRDKAPPKFRRSYDSQPPPPNLHVPPSQHAATPPITGVPASPFYPYQPQAQAYPPAPIGSYPQAPYAGQPLVLPPYGHVPMPGPEFPPFPAPQADERRLKRLEREMKDFLQRQKQQEELQGQAECDQEKQREREQRKRLEKQVRKLKLELQREKEYRAAPLSADLGRERPGPTIQHLINTLRSSQPQELVPRQDDGRMEQLLQEVVERLRSSEGRSLVDRRPVEAPRESYASNISTTSTTSRSEIEDVVLDILGRISLTGDEEREPLPLLPASHSGGYSTSDVFAAGNQRQRRPRDFVVDDERGWSPSSGTAVNNTSDAYSPSESSHYSHSTRRSVTSEPSFDRARNSQASHSAAFRPQMLRSRTNASDPGGEYYTNMPRKATPMHDPHKYTPTRTKRPAARTVQSAPVTTSSTQQTRGRKSKSTSNTKRSAVQQVHTKGQPGVDDNLDDDYRSGEVESDLEPFPPRGKAPYMFSSGKLPNSRDDVRPTPPPPPAPNPPTGLSASKAARSGRRQVSNQLASVFPDHDSSDQDDDGYFEKPPEPRQRVQHRRRDTARDR